MKRLVSVAGLVWLLLLSSTPPGHFNAVFVKDLGPLNDPDILKQARLAAEPTADCG